MADFFVSKLGTRENRADTIDWSKLVAPNAPQPAPETWTTPEAFVAILLAAVTCDGEIAAVEHEEILALVHRSRALKSLSSEQLAAINIKVANRLRMEKEALGAACAALPEQMRLPVFAHALDLILADGELNIEEANCLNALIQYLNLDRSDVERIAGVISLKNLF